MNVQKYNNQIFFCCMQHYVASTSKILIDSSTGFSDSKQKACDDVSGM
jgi:hypothetical protein